MSTYRNDGSNADRTNTRWSGVRRAIALVGLCAASHQVFAADWYVDGANGSNSNPGTEAAPFQTFYALNKVLQPGDTAHILPGTYTTMLNIEKSGTAAAPITYMGSSKRGKKTKILVTGSFGVHLNPGVSYVNVRFLDVRSTDRTGIWTGAGTHHVTFSNIVAHDCGGSGIGAYASDYITIRDNTVYNNAWTNPEQGSGINLLSMVNYDNKKGFHNRIYKNTVYNNANKVFKTGTTITSDGNGIILDDWRHTQAPQNGPAYSGSTLIENNVVFNNGGRGIHIYNTDNVVVRANTVYWNNWDPNSQDYHSGEIETYKAGNVTVVNNIMYSHGGANGPDVAFSAEWTSGGPVTADYNLTYGAAPYSMRNSTIQYWGSHNVNADPQFMNMTTEPALADFRVKHTSPALALGTDTSTPKIDVLGDERPLPGPITAGAYQKSAQ